MKKYSIDFFDATDGWLYLFESEEALQLDDLEYAIVVANSFQALLDEEDKGYYAVFDHDVEDIVYSARKGGE